jgi:putative NIF3 family GTP cyclohydrolase 1 type 2
MKLEGLYRKAVASGIANDLRGREEILRLLEAERERFEKLPDGEKEDFDRDRLFNPFADTRILNGDPGVEVRTAIVGIDMEVGEILLAHVLNRDRDARIDLVIAHHPEGYALARLHDVMRLQADLLAACGIPVAVAEQLMEKRIGEVERRIMPVNHERAVDAARALGLPMLCVHTPADNCVTSFLTRLFLEKAPRTLKDLVGLLREIPEYRRSARRNAAPKIVNGSDGGKCGRIFVDMTGGTEGSKDIFDRYASAGISTLVGMHLSEDALEKAKKASLNVVIAGHVSSDTLGLNLLFDEIEKDGAVEFVTVSGFERIRRPAG